MVKWSRDTDRFPKLEASTRLLSALAGQGCARSVANHFPERIGPGNTGRAFVRSVVHRTAGVGGRLVGRAGPTRRSIRQEHVWQKYTRTLGATHVDGSVFSSRSTGLKERIGGWLENFDRRVRA